MHQIIGKGPTLEKPRLQTTPQFHGMVSRQACLWGWNVGNMVPEPVAFPRGPCAGFRGRARRTSGSNQNLKH